LVHASVEGLLLIAVAVHHDDVGAAGFLAIHLLFAHVVLGIWSAWRSSETIFTHCVDGVQEVIVEFRLGHHGLTSWIVLHLDVHGVAITLEREGLALTFSAFFALLTRIVGFITWIQLVHEFIPLRIPLKFTTIVFIDFDTRIQITDLDAFTALGGPGGVVYCIGRIWPQALRILVVSTVGSAGEGTNILAVCANFDALLVLSVRVYAFWRLDLRVAKVKEEISPLGWELGRLCALVIIEDLEIRSHADICHCRTICNRLLSILSSIWFGLLVKVRDLKRLARLFKSASCGRNEEFGVHVRGRFDAFAVLGNIGRFGGIGGIGVFALVVLVLMIELLNLGSF